MLLLFRELRTRCLRGMAIQSDSGRLDATFHRARKWQLTDTQFNISGTNGH